MEIIKKIKITLPIIAGSIFLILFLSFPLFTLYALDYVPLAPLPGTTATAGATTLETYLMGMFKLGIVLAGVLTFLMIVIGGFQYLSTDAMTGKEEGKERIERAVGGLILALASYVILFTINPNLVNFDLNFGTAAREGSNYGQPGPISIQGTKDLGQKLDARLAELNELRKDPAVINAVKAKADANDTGKLIQETTDMISELGKGANGLDPTADDIAEINRLQEKRDQLILTQNQLLSQTGAATAASLITQIKTDQTRGEQYGIDGDTVAAQQVIDSLKASSAQKIKELTDIGQNQLAAQLKTEADAAIAKIEYRKRCPKDFIIIYLPSYKKIYCQ